jgi:preprotein translocase subunit YajC
MKKNDRIITIGGLIGTVASISNDGKEVTIKVDDNTRLKFLSNSIREVISEKSKDDDDKSDSSKS